LKDSDFEIMNVVKLLIENESIFYVYTLRNAAPRLSRQIKKFETHAISKLRAKTVYALYV